MSAPPSPRCPACLPARLATRKAGLAERTPMRNAKQAREREVALRLAARTSPPTELLRRLLLAAQFQASAELDCAAHDAVAVQRALAAGGADAMTILASQPMTILAEIAAVAIGLWFAVKVACVLWLTARLPVSNGAGDELRRSLDRRGGDCGNVARLQHRNPGVDRLGRQDTQGRLTVLGSTLVLAAQCASSKSFHPTGTCSRGCWLLAGLASPPWPKAFLLLMGTRDLPGQRKQTSLCSGSSSLTRSSATSNKGFAPGADLQMRSARSNTPSVSRPVVMVLSARQPQL
jgi:hypothetical protein